MKKPLPECFILWLKVGAPLWDARIPDDRSPIGREILHHAADGFYETVDRVGRFAAGVREFADGEERAVNVVVAVDEEELHGEVESCKLRVEWRVI